MIAAPPKSDGAGRLFMENADKSLEQAAYAAAWTDYLATEVRSASHLVTGHVAAILARDLTDAPGAHNSVIVDLGCGTGALHSDLKTAGVAFREYVGIDTNSVLVEEAQSRAPAGARYFVVDLTDPSEQDKAISTAGIEARPEDRVYTLVRILNYLPDRPAAALLQKLAERAAGARVIILDVYPGPINRPSKDNPLKSKIEHEIMGGADVVHYFRDPFQYVDFFSARKIVNMCARSAYLRGDTAPSHFTISGRFEGKP